MNLTKSFVFIAAGTLFFSSLVNASQIAGIDIYGYFQSELLYERSITKAFGSTDTSTRSSSEVAELDLFFQQTDNPENICSRQPSAYRKLFI